MTAASKRKVVWELSRLVTFGLRLEVEEKVCVFVNVSGHVDWIQVSIRKSKEDYWKELGKWNVIYKNYENKFIQPLELAKRVDTVIKEMKEVAGDLAKATKKAEEEQEQRDLVKLEELKAKYEAKR